MGAIKTSIFLTIKQTIMKKIKLTMQEFYNEFISLAKSENVQYSYERSKSNMEVTVSKEFCEKFKY
mgnify:CR=1 FL=1